MFRIQRPQVQECILKNEINVWGYLKITDTTENSGPGLIIKLWYTSQQECM